MYTSVVDLTTKQGKARELTQAANNKVRPLLEKQTGFVDVTVIVSTRSQIASSRSASGIRERMSNATSGNNSMRCTRHYDTFWKLRRWCGLLLSTPQPPTGSPPAKRTETITTAPEGRVQT
jgi:hypothetical protein